MPKLGREAKRALNLLARSSEGSTQALLLAYGFTDRLIASLIKAGLRRRDPTGVGAAWVDVWPRFGGSRA